MGLLLFFAIFLYNVINLEIYKIREVGYMKETLEEAKKKFSGEWIAFLVHEEKEELEKMEGEVIEHHRDRRELHKKLRERNVRNAYITFAGPLIKPGYSVMF